jgi:molecular chaperone DnaK
MGRVVGIDLGTTNSCVAIVDRGETTVIANREGSRTTPSIVGFTPTGEKIVGQIAKRQSLTNPANTVFAVKRLIGRRFDEEDVKRFIEVAPFEICPADNGDAWVKLDGKMRSPEEISAQILMQLKETAQDFLGEQVTEAVITVPAYFNDSQRQATKDAGRIAGLTVQRIINEPTAAALAYGLEKKGSETIAVFDLGGGTFDVSILKIGDGVFEVLATHGDTYLGGEDFDELLVKMLAERFTEQHGLDPRDDPMALQRLKEAAERAKQELSSSEETDVNLPFVAADESGPKHLLEVLTREQVEELVEPLIERLEAPCRCALSDAGLEPENIDQVVLVGGMTRMPRVIRVGAAIQGSVLSGEQEEVLLLDVAPLSLGVETQGGVMTRIVPRNTTIPTQKREVFSTTEDNQSLVRIHVVQGEREMAADNKTLGRFELVGIAPAPRGVPQIEVSFDIDGDGILRVSARDLGTGQAQQIEVTATGGLSPEEVDQLIDAAKEHSESDAARREEVELRNMADGLLYSVEQSLEEFGAQLEQSEQAEVRDSVGAARKALQGTNLEALREAIAELQDTAYRMTEAMYERLGEGSGSGAEDAGDDDGASEADDSDDSDPQDETFS